MPSEDAPQPVSPDGAPRETRKISDAQTFRALAHPVRMALLEALLDGGPQTATQVAERISETPTTCSFHLRQLAKYGFVEEAGGGKGRSRPWRMTSVGMSLTSSPEDPEVQLATNAVAHMFRERQFARYQAWLETRHAFPTAWREAAPDSQFLFYLTAEELAELSADLDRLLLPRFMDRITDPARRPAGSVPVEMMLLGYPIRLPAAGDGDSGASAGGPADGSREDPS